MFQTRKYNKVFHLAQSLKDFVSAGKAFDQDFSILPLYGRDSDGVDYRLTPGVHPSWLHDVGIVHHDEQIGSGTRMSPLPKNNILHEEVGKY
jgi:hypothetical protein